MPSYWLAGHAKSARLDWGTSSCRPLACWFEIVLVSTAYLSTSVHAFQTGRSAVKWLKDPYRAWVRFCPDRPSGACGPVRSNGCKGSRSERCQERASLWRTLVTVTADHGRPLAVGMPRSLSPVSEFGKLVEHWPQCLGTCIGLGLKLAPLVAHAADDGAVLLVP